MAALELTDAKNKIENLTGVDIKPGGNPYEALIDACDDDPAKIQALYATHRTARNAQQKAKFLDPGFQELVIDPFLLRIEDPSIDPAFVDPRHSVVLWARPPEHILRLAAAVQARLKKAAPNLWLMPLHRMHMTALELAFARAADEADGIVQALAAAPQSAGTEPGTALPALVSLPSRHRPRARLVQPMVSYDLAACALSFVPAAGNRPYASPPPDPPAAHPAVPDDAYSYHHLRRDLYAGVRDAGLDVASRYVVPSAHITLGRFLTQADHATPAARQAWVAALDDINAWLARDVWDAQWAVAPGRVPPPPAERLVGEWIVGQERGLDARAGALWYGGGRTLLIGEGF